MESNNNTPTPGPNPSSSYTADGLPIAARLPATPPPQPKKEGFRNFLGTLGIIIAAPIVALFLTLYVFQSYEVDGPSMETTLDNRDRLLVLKFPHTWAKITNNDYIPNRGDIIIFNTTAVRDGSNDMGQKQLIKRVIGLPGDRVVVQDGLVTLYNAENPEGYNPDKAGEWREAITTTPGNADVLVNEGEVFVLGDNRTNSTDSRVIGAVPSDDIVGKLIFRIFPISNAEVF
jgi:signal peptidase I